MGSHTALDMVHPPSVGTRMFGDSLLKGCVKGVFLISGRGKSLTGQETIYRNCRVTRRIVVM